MTLSAEDVAFARSLVIHEDAHLLVFNKPSGLPVQGGSGITQSLEHLLAAFAKSNGKRARLVHRLDRETSGVIVAARTKPAAAFLSEAFAGRDVRKTYFGLDMMEIAVDGQAALTCYRTLRATPETAWLELAPETGRMHQLRAHLAAIGRPIAGDGKYGGLYRLGAVEISRLMLHAARLDLPHPAGGRSQFAAPLPGDMAEPLRSLGLEPTPGESC